MSSPTPRTRSVAAASCAASRVSQLTAAADALTSNEDCWLLVGEAILRTHDLQVYASWRLASKACLGAWQHSFDATAPWLSIWPANLERYLWQASVPHFDGESGGGPGCHSFDHGEGMGREWRRLADRFNERFGRAWRRLLDFFLHQHAIDFYLICTTRASLLGCDIQVEPHLIVRRGAPNEAETVLRRARVPAEIDPSGRGGKARRVVLSIEGGSVGGRLAISPSIISRNLKARNSTPHVLIGAERLEDYHPWHFGSAQSHD